MKPKKEKPVRPSVNLERQIIDSNPTTIPLEDLFYNEKTDKYDIRTLDDLARFIKEETKETNPKLILENIAGANYGFSLLFSSEREENDTEYDARILKERQAQNRFDAVKRNELAKAKAILDKYGETL